MTTTGTKAGEIIQHIKNGGQAFILSYTKILKLDAKVLEKWERAGYTLLKDEGRGFRMRMGKGSIYVLPEQMRLV
jgi:hypothetical protein